MTVAYQQFLEGKRRYAREWARRKRARALDEQRRASRTCPRRMGPGVCGGELRWVRDPSRQWKWGCPRCERREAGICQDCDQPVEGRKRSALRCAKHKAERRNFYTTTYRERHPNKWRAYSRRYARAHRQAMREYKRCWRKLNREKVRAQKRRAALRRPQRVYEYQRGYRMAAEIEGRKYVRATHRECLTCSTPVSGRVKKCQQCKVKEAHQARELLIARYAAKRRPT